jgi:Ca-activated chloride channel family protein
MTLRRLISLSLLLAAQKLCAQLAPAEDFFNSGAQFYISNNVPAALARVESGLKFYPDDDKLKKLEALLKQQQQSQQNQQQQNQQNNQQSQSQKSDSQKNQQQQNQQSQKDNSQDQQKPNQADQKKEDQQKSSADKSGGDQKDQQQADAQPVKPGEMTPEEAKRLLDAQKDNEQLLQMKPKDKPRDPDRPLRDW